MSSLDVPGALAAGYAPSDIANDMAQHASFNVEAARKSGYSDSEIIDYLQPNSLPKELQGGLHDALHGVSQTASALQGVAERNNFPTVGGYLGAAAKGIDAVTPAEVPEKPDANVGEALKNPNATWGDVGHAVVHSAARALPGTVPILAAGALPGVGPALAGGVAGLESLGPTAYQRAQNNGRDTPDTSDVVGALPSTAVNAVAGSVLPGGAAGRIANPVLRGAAKTGIEAGSGAVMDAANQLGGSVGTQAGTQFDPYEMAGVGLTQGAIGAGREVLPTARAGIKSAADNVMSRIGDQPVSVEDAASMSRVGKAYDAQLQAVQDTRGGSTRPTDVLNSLKVENLQRTQAYARELAKAGILSDDLMGKVSAVLEQARRHNNEITDGGPDTSSLFDDIKNSGVNADALQPLLNGIRDQNTLSKQSFLKNQTGPFQQLGNGIAQVGAIGGALASGNIPAAFGLGLGHGVVGKAGGIIGGALDSALGTATPKILLQRLAADRYLKAAGADAGPSTLGSLADATQTLQGLRAAPQDSPATPPENRPFTVGSPVPDPAQEAIDRSKAWAKVQGKASAAPDIEDAWAKAEAGNSAAAQKQQIYQSGANLPGQSVDPLSGVPTESPGMAINPNAQAALDASNARNAGENARRQQGIDDLLNRIANRKVDAQSVDSLAQAKIDRAVKANSVNLAAADKLPTDTVHADSIAGQAAMVRALDQAKAVMNRGNSATDDLRDRMTTGLPAGDLMGLGDEPQRYKTTPEPSQPAPAPSQAPPMANAPEAAPGPSGPAPALNPDTLATQGRPWEQYVGKTLPGATRGQVKAAVESVHTPEMAAQINAHMGGIDAAHLQPVIENLRAQQAPANGTSEIAMPRQWEAGKANYQAQVAQAAAEAKAVGLPETSEALAQVGLTKGREAKAQLRDAHLASILDAAKRSQAAALFNKRLMNHGPK